MPLPEAEPTEDQLAALQLRGTPYAHFSGTHTVWSEASIKLHCEPGHGFCRQMEVTRRSSSQASGHHRLGSLLACQQSPLLCLRYPVGETSARRGNERLVVTVSALDEYFEASRALCQELPQRGGTWPSQRKTGAGPSTSQG